MDMEFGGERVVAVCSAAAKFGRHNVFNMEERLEVTVIHRSFLCLKFFTALVTRL